MRSARRAASRTLCVTNSTVNDRSAPELLELVVQQVARHRVERAERLVHEQHVGVLRERAGERDALAHAAGQLVRAPIGELVEAHGVQQLLGPLAALLAARPCARAQPERELDVAARR